MKKCSTFKDPKNAERLMRNQSQTTQKYQQSYVESLWKVGEKTVIVYNKFIVFPIKSQCFSVNRFIINYICN